MEIQVKISLPDDLADLDSERVSRNVLEQVAAEGYKDRRLSLKDVRRLLGFSSRMETEKFLHSYKVYEYTLDDLSRDLEGLKDLGLR